MSGTTPAGANGPVQPKSVDLSKLSSLSRNEWIAAGAGLAGFVASFLPWYTVKFDGKGLITGSSSSYSSSAWDVNFGGWFPVLLLVAVAGVIIARALGAKFPAQVQAVLPLGLLIAPALAAVIILLRWVTYPGGSNEFASAGAGFGLFVGLLAALAATAAGWLSFRAATATRSAGA